MIQGCLGALDGTHVDILVSKADKDRYRNRKGQILFNMLGVCNTDRKFVYILSGWEGSATDSWVLRDAIKRPERYYINITHMNLNKQERSSITPLQRKRRQGYNKENMVTASHGAPFVMREKGHRVASCPQ
ncbi:UNVERIFIED_CONTAM: hypothetical protein Sradi_5689100 [Sesamum radiatum]|uniref:DDE Tnp4 domain-containing protein n=1 Tax=Sesamum radiatum TaxID=300843 RepID=A0AAW2L2M9_SESRA